MKDFITFTMPNDVFGPITITLARKRIDSLTSYQDGTALVGLSDGLNNGSPLKIIPEHVEHVRRWLETGE